MFRFSPKFLRFVQHRVNCYTKDVKTGPEVRKTMLQGNIESLTGTVSVTLGPKDRNDILELILRSPTLPLPSPPPSSSSSSSSSVSSEFSPKESSAKLMRELACKADEIVCGTKAIGSSADNGIATILSHTIIKSSYEKISLGANPTEIRRGVLLALNEVKRHLKTMSRPLTTPEEIEEVARIYTKGNRDIAKIVCDAINLVINKGAVISIRKSRGNTDKLELIEGMKFNSGFVSPYFINTPSDESVEFPNALLLLTGSRISSMKPIMSVVELASSKRSPLVIIADDIGGEALKDLVLTRLRTGLRVVAVKAPSYGDNRVSILKDIAIATGGTVFSENRENIEHIDKIKIEDLGKVGNVIVTKDDTLLLNGMGKRVKILRRIDEIKDQIANATTSVKKNNLRERLANLVSGIAMIHVSGSNERQVNMKIDRIKFALNATRSAIEEGIVPGCGIALLKCISSLDSVEGCNDTQRMGIEIVRRALRMPCLTIATKAGVNGPMVISHVENIKDDNGVDALKGELGNLIEMGMVDPTKLILKALTDAAGVASLLITAETANVNNISRRKLNFT